MSFPLPRPVRTCTALHLLAVERRGPAGKGGQRAPAVMMGYARVGGDSSPLFLWDTSRTFRAPSVRDFQGGFRNSYSTHKNRGLDAAFSYKRSL